MKRTRMDDHKQEGEVESDMTLANGDQEQGNYSCGILRLPEACLAHAISMTSPVNTLRCSAVSTAFHAAASSDVVWESFLPADYRSILAQADHPVDFTSTKKELFLTLAEDHAILNQGTKSFWLERTSGAKCYMLSSRSLTLTWGGNPLYWRRIYSPDSRFEEVAELIAVCWFDVTGVIDSGELSPNTKYGAYLVFNLADAYSLDCPMEASIFMGDQIVSPKHAISLHPRATQEIHRPSAEEPSSSNMKNKEPDEKDVDEQGYPRERDDGWMEVEIGEFNNDANSGLVTIRLLNLDDYYWKRGLLLEGIELRQKK